jgi:hypothetical protein
VESLAEKLVAVHGDAPDTAGAIVWWRLSGTIRRDELGDAWGQAGLTGPDDLSLPDYTTPKQALQRALPVVEDKRHFLRSLPQHGGWAVVEEHLDSTTTLAHQVVATVSVKDDRLVIDPPDYRDAGRIEEEFLACLERLETTDVSGWLAGTLMPAAKAVTLRDTGGIYFIPREYVDLYKRYTDVLAAVGAHRFFLVPALRSDEAVEAILDALCREAEQAALQVETELDNERLGKRALLTRMDAAEAMLAKVRTYESLLGRGLDQLVQRIEGLKAGITVAMLSKESVQLPFVEEA